MPTVKSSTPVGNELIKAPTDAGYDLRNAEGSQILKPGAITLVNTNVRIQMPKGLYAMV